MPAILAASSVHPMHDAQLLPATAACTVSAQVRLGEKEGLDTALRWFEDRSRRLDKLEYYQVRICIRSP